MLKLVNICKNYKTGDFNQQALDNINLSFNENEFVSILGPSGSGKTTLLNIIGGLDRYDSGDLIIKGKSTKKFKNKDFDSYRNKSIGFIFQNYNLITHIDILSNVEMGMTLSGLKKRKRRKIALELLEKVNLKEHRHKKPNQLSGGQMQRVAIARALSNNPEIILADEPTGALDSSTSTQIMKLIKDISKDKLVIMVTHNEELAKEYSDRIINMKDGKVIGDTQKNTVEEIDKKYVLNKTKMKFLTALNLSLNNIKTKKGRTLLMSFASSIGIIGISLILALSNGFSKQIEKFERNTSDVMPIMITHQKQNVEEIKNEIISSNKYKNKKLYSDKNIINVTEKKESKYNNISNEFVSYIKNMNPNYMSSLGFNHSLKLNLIQNSDDGYYMIDSLELFKPLPIRNFNDKKVSEIITNYYDLLYGKLPTSYNELLLEIDKSNSIDENIKKILNIKDNVVSFDQVIDKEIKVVNNDELYKEYNGNFVINKIDENMYNSSNNITLKVVGIIRAKKEKENLINSSCNIYYKNELIDHVISKNSNSNIVRKQKDSEYNILTGTKLSSDEKRQLLDYLGDISNPKSIYIYPKNFDSKDKIVKYIENYNRGKKEDNKISYLDQAQLITNISGGIMSGITSVLVAFSSISLIVSSIMIGIITYISVLERTKEIGILRSLGARKKDIRRVFNAETFIIGLFSGILGILISRLLLIPINNILFKLTGLDNIAIMNIKYSIMLIIISIILTLVGGAIPSNLASKKDPVQSLRTE